MNHRRIYYCPLELSLNVVGGKWKTVILWQLNLWRPGEKVLRFAELKRLISGISQKILTQQLRELEEDGLIIRKVYAEVPPKVEYSITEYAKTLKSALETLWEWGEEHRERLGMALSDTASPKPLTEERLQEDTVRT